jgi:hypothetical protein
LARWLGGLFLPAEDPRPEMPAASNLETLLEDLRRSRAELAHLRDNLDVDSPVAKQLESEEAALVEAEQNLVESVNEQRARAALLRARRRATEAELLSDL